MNPRKRYLAAVEVNLDHLQRAQMAWICTQGFSAAGTPSHLFAKLCFNALFNDYISKCAKVFELGRQAASLWYVERTDPAGFLAALGGDKVYIEQMKDIAVSLKHLRDRDLMHIDELGVLDRPAVWKSAGIDPSRLQVAVKLALLVLRQIADQNGVQVPPIPRQLSGPNARRIAKHLYNFVH
jgi:hypothetical protein